MLKRTVTALLGLPVMVVLVVAGHTPLRLGLFLLSVVGMNEMYRATLSDRHRTLRMIAYAFTALYYVMIGNVGSVFSAFYLMTIQQHFSNFFLIFAAIFIIALLIALVILYPKVSFADCALILVGFFQIAFLFSFIYLVRQYTYGKYFVWLIFISAWGCDTFAYFTGITLGRHKLTPLLSPKKTVEGAIGGAVGAAALAALYGYAVARLFTLPDIHVVLFFTVAGAVGAVFAQFGDLAASAIKRSTGIKDYGHILPGHGGVMDRFDSVLFTAPVIYMVMFVLLNFFKW